MTSRGVKIEDTVVGTGQVATRQSRVVASVRIFLNQGDEVRSEPRMRIDLYKRDCIAGLRYGIEGMCVGGRRRLIIGSHLAYGKEGLPDLIPPNAVLKCDVDLLEVHERGAKIPDDYPPGRHLHVFRPGEAARNLPRWQFGLDDDGRCGLLITSPIAGMPWRRVRYRSLEDRLDPATTDELFQTALTLPTRSPNDCLGQEDLWSDQAEPGNGITRDRQTNTLCLTIYVMEQGEYLCYYSLRETSSVWLSSFLRTAISGLLEREGRMQT